jgi:hypothetical protein
VTVQELIDALQKTENKQAPVFFDPGFDDDAVFTIDEVEYDEESATLFILGE